MEYTGARANMTSPPRCGYLDSGVGLQLCPERGHLRAIVLELPTPSQRAQWGGHNRSSVTQVPVEPVAQQALVYAPE